MNTPPASHPYRCHRFPTAIISHRVWLYVRCCLSDRDVKELVFARGVIVTYEAVRKWCVKFGQPYANQLRRRRLRPGDTWHLDEIFLTINGVRQYLRRAVDQERHVLDILVQRRRDKHAAMKFFRQLLKGWTYVPWVIHHGSAQKLWCGEAGHAPRCGTSSALLSQPPCGAFTPTDPPAGAAHAGVYITGARATRPRRVWSDGPTCQTETPPAPCPRVSSRNGANDAKAGGSSQAWSWPPKSRPRCTPPTSLAAGGIGTHTWPTPDSMHRRRALEGGERC